MRWNSLKRPIFGEDIWVYTSSDNKIFPELIQISAEGYSESPLIRYFTRGNLKALSLYQMILLNAVLIVGGWVTAVKDRESGKIIATAWWLPLGVSLPVGYIFKQFSKIIKTLGWVSTLIASYSFIKVIFTEVWAIIKHDLNKKPCVHLVNIVVCKEYRGQRYAATLMKPMIKWADENGVVLYLEADGETNIKYVYPPFGFQIFRWIKLFDKKVKYAAMIRFPKNS